MEIQLEWGENPLPFDSIGITCHMSTPSTPSFNVHAATDTIFQEQVRYMTLEIKLYLGSHMTTLKRWIM